MAQGMGRVVRTGSGMAMIVDVVVLVRCLS